VVCLCSSIVVVFHGIYMCGGALAHASFGMYVDSVVWQAHMHHLGCMLTQLFGKHTLVTDV